MTDKNMCDLNRTAVDEKVLSVSDFPSKKQFKKHLKQIRWLKTKVEKRAKEKLKLKEKKKQAKLLNVQLEQSLTRKCVKMTDSPCKVSVVIDLSFDHLMNNKDIGKVIKQILRCYTENRRSSSPLQLHISNLNGASLEYIKKYTGYEKWDVHFHSNTFLETFDKNDLLYLTSDSENVVSELSASCVYVIGGLVDHNAHKGLCYKNAVEQGIKHGQLPISNYLKMKRRKTLTINQVFEILLRVCEGKTFLEAFQTILPKRYNVELLKTEEAQSVIVQNTIAVSN